MLRIKPFDALRPTPENAPRVASVPYDVVNRDEAAELASGNPASFLHIVRSEIDLPADVNPYDDAVYAKARENLDRFQAEGLLTREGQECIYLYRQSTERTSQTGVVCCCHIDDYEADIIKKHEKTRKAKEDDRTRHVLTLNANTGPVFLTYRDRDDINDLMTADMSEEPLIDFHAPDEVRHTIWRVKNADPYVKAFAQIPVAYVADGHHRSASAWRAGQERRKADPAHDSNKEYNWFLAVLFPAGNLTIMAYNRVIKDLNGFSADDVLDRLRTMGTISQTQSPYPDSKHSFCFYFGNNVWYRFDIDPSLIDESDAVRSLDVALLQDRIIEPLFGIQDPRTDERIDFVGGIRGAGELKRRVDSGDWACAVSMYPTEVEDLMGVADAGQIMPPKSTWFEPKLRSGLLVHTLD
ncbi:MAG: DUF1015 domain-containing protein [Planctomycetota bacterium]